MKVIGSGRGEGCVCVVSERRFTVRLVAVRPALDPTTQRRGINYHVHKKNTHLM